MKKKLGPKIHFGRLKLQETDIFATKTPLNAFVFVTEFEMIITQNIEWQVHNFFPQNFNN